MKVRLLGLFDRVLGTTPHPPIPRELEPMLPQGTYRYVHPWLARRPVLVRIVKPRRTRYGDYRFTPRETIKHTITLNADLPPWHAFITLVHEIAHLEVAAEGNHRSLPHGRTWQKIYSWHLRQLLDWGVFPPELKPAIEQHLHSPSAASCTDQALFKALHYVSPHKSVSQGWVLLDTLPHGSRYQSRDGQVYILGKMVRTRFAATQEATGKPYRFSPVATVLPLGGLN